MAEDMAKGIDRWCADCGMQARFAEAKKHSEETNHLVWLEEPPAEAQAYPQTHPAMAVARNLVNQILDRFVEELPGGRADDAANAVRARQAINDECDQFAALLIDRYGRSHPEVCEMVREEQPRLESRARTRSFAPMFGFPTSAWYRWFAWRPVRTEDRGWRWGRVLWRRSVHLKPFLPGGGRDRWFQHAVRLPD